MYTATHNPYREHSVATAGPAQLVLMLYDRALTAVARVQAVAEPRRAESIAVVNHELQRAQDILAELRATLDYERGGHLSRALDALYGFCIDRLIEVNVSKDRTGLEPVLTILRDLRDAWEIACCKVAVTTA